MHISTVAHDRRVVRAVRHHADACPRARGGDAPRDERARRSAGALPRVTIFSSLLAGSRRRPRREPRVVRVHRLPVVRDPPRRKRTRPRSRLRRRAAVHGASSEGRCTPRRHRSAGRAQPQGYRLSLVGLERVATGEVYVISDSNVRGATRTYLWSLVAELENERAGVGMVTSLFAGTWRAKPRSCARESAACARRPRRGLAAMQTPSAAVRSRSASRWPVRRREILAVLGGFRPVGPRARGGLRPRPALSGGGASRTGRRSRSVENPKRRVLGWRARF